MGWRLELIIYMVYLLSLYVIRDIYYKVYNNEFVWL